MQEHKYDFSGCSPNCLTCTFSIQIIVLGRSFTHPQMATYLTRVYQCRKQQMIQIFGTQVKRCAQCQKKNGIHEVMASEKVSVHTCKKKDDRDMIHHFHLAEMYLLSSRSSIRVGVISFLLSSVFIYHVGFP